MLRAALLEWHAAQRSPHPWREPASAVLKPYRVWVSEVMLQQTTLAVVTPVYIAFMERFPTLMALAAASEEELRSAVRGLGYYRRFALLHRAAKQVLAASPDPAAPLWPHTFEGWLALPGVGDYTAAAVSSIAFAVAQGVLDGNVERIFCRLFDQQVAPNSPALKKVFRQLANILVDPEVPGFFNEALMELGQKICRKAEPLCAVCPLQPHCLATQRGTTHLAPAAKERTAPIEVALQLTIPQCHHDYALLPRSKDARFLKGTAGFLTTDNESAVPKQAQYLGTISHNITHHRIKAAVYLWPVAQPKLVSATSLRWLAADDLEAQLVSNLDRKAWLLLQRKATKLSAEQGM